MALKPEMIGDVEEGAAPAGGLDEMGLTPEERSAWNEMEAAAKETAPAADESEEAPETPVEAPPAPETEAAAEGEEDAENAPEATPDPKTGKQPPKTVNYSKYSRDLAKRDAQIKAAEADRQTERINNAKLAERLAILNEALTAPPPVDPAVAQQQAVAANPMLEPDIKVEEDALGAIAQLQRRNAFLLERQTQTHETTQATLEDRQLRDDFERDASMYARTADGQHFGAAYQFLKDSRLTELAISLFDKDPTDPAAQFTQQEISKLVSDFNTEEKWVVSNARKTGKSPSAAIMKLAKSRGFKAQAPAAPASVASVPVVQNGGGIPPAAAVPSAVAKIQAETEGAAASRSLSDGGGGPPAQALTAERLLKMSDVEFGKYVDNLPKEQLESIMGRPEAGRAA